MENPFAPIQHINLRDLLYERATLYSGNERIRLGLVEQTLAAAAHGIDLNPDLSVHDALFEILHDIAGTDLRIPAFGGSARL